MTTARRLTLAGAVALGLAAGGAWAAVLQDVVSPEAPGAVETAWGTGWRSAIRGDDETGSDALKFPAARALRAEAGTVELEFVRDNVEDQEALFSLVSLAGRTILVVSVRWDDGANSEGISVLDFNGRDWEGRLWKGTSGLPGGATDANFLALPRIGRGQRAHVALTWGASASQCNVYVNGRRLAAEVDRDFALPGLIRNATWLVVGAEPKSDGSPGAYSHMHSLLQRFRTHDRVLSPGEFTVGGERVLSVAAEKASYGAGQEVVVTLRGAPDGTAAFTIEGVAADVAMEEVDDGVYVGKVAVPAGMNVVSAALTGTLTDPASGQKATLLGKPVAIDGEAPVAPARVLATVPWAGEVEVGWEASASGDVAHYLVYRGAGQAPDLAGTPLAEVKGLVLVDTAVVAGLTYQYAVVAVDRAGNPSAPSELVSATAVAGEGPAISAITVEPFGKPVKPGQVVSVAVTGQSGGQLTVDLEGLAAGLVLAEQGRTGQYQGTYTVTDADVGPTKTVHRVVAHLADAYGASELAGPEVAIVGRDTLNDTTPPVIAQASHDGFQVAGFSGKLVAGDVLTVTLEGEPGGYASFAIPGVVAGAAMNESTAKPGTYTGTYTVGWGDEGSDVAVVAKLADEAGNEASLAVGPVRFDTRVRLLATAKDGLLPADKKATTRLVTQATDANGDEISGHELALTLSTTEEYTGVVGGGRVEDREARIEDEDDVEIKWGGVTDNFGEVAATYTAGFAAKTALIVAKDLTTGDVGVGWLNTYVASTVVIELLPRAAARGMADKAILRLTADPAWLTADGRSTARLTATLTDLGGNPLNDQKVAFALGSDNGRVRVLRGTTDERGVAEAEYRAGTLAGTVTVTASAAEWGVTGAVQIELRADAPAKIDLAASATKLPADGRSEATLSVLVTDIHDNPNIDAPVSFQVLEGSGSVGPGEIRTDRNGEGSVTFTAGAKAGLTTIEARHTSRAPTDEELRRVYGTVFVPRLAERQERDRIKVAEWLVEPGDEVTKGQPIVVLEGGKGSWTLAAPEQGVFVREVRHRRDRVELGDTLGYVEVDPDVWQDEYAK